MLRENKYGPSQEVGLYNKSSLEMANVMINVKGLQAGVLLLSCEASTDREETRPGVKTLH